MNWSKIELNVCTIEGSRIGVATIVIDLAIIPQVPTDVFLLFAGNIRSSVNETYVVIMKPVMMPIFIIKIRIGINLSSKVSLEPWFSNLKNLIYTRNIPTHPKIDIKKAL